MSEAEFKPLELEELMSRPCAKPESDNIRYKSVTLLRRSGIVSYNIENAGHTSKIITADLAGVIYNPNKMLVIFLQKNPDHKITHVTYEAPKARIVHIRNPFEPLHAQIDEFLKKYNYPDLSA